MVKWIKHQPIFDYFEAVRTVLLLHVLNPGQADPVWMCRGLVRS
jgi:hypothetical protein